MGEPCLGPAYTVLQSRFWYGLHIPAAVGGQITGPLPRVNGAADKPGAASLKLGTFEIDQVSSVRPRLILPHHRSGLLSLTTIPAFPAPHPQTAGFLFSGAQYLGD